jgi:hypothetical protein
MIVSSAMVDAENPAIECHRALHLRWNVTTACNNRSQVWRKSLGGAGFEPNTSTV